MDKLIENIKNLAKIYSDNLKDKIETRLLDMKSDDNSHYLLYQVLGVSLEEGQLIDQYQNTGRFLYKYAGSFLEEVAILCLNFKFPEGIKTRIENTVGKRPKTFEIDFLNGNDAIEVKWRDSTTDGDHITKEHTRIEVIKKQGYKPIRIMFYYPQREQAIKVQKTLKTVYAGFEGEYYTGDDAWEFLKTYSGVDLKSILEQIAKERVYENGN